MITIKRNLNTVVATVKPLSSSTATKAVMGEETVRLSWVDTKYTALEIGDYIEYEGARWRLKEPADVEKTGGNRFAYNAVFKSPKYDAADALYMLFDNTPTPPKSEFSLTGNARTFMELLVANLNRAAGGTVWTLGQLPEETGYVTLTFSAEDCLSVLSRLAEEFKTEYHFAGYTVHLKRISTEREITLQYPSTLYGIERVSVDASALVTRLYPFGARRNLPAGYRGGNMPLCLPETAGQYIESPNKAMFGVIEQVKTFEQIYPRLGAGGAGSVTGVGDAKTFTDTALDFNVNDCLLDGTPAKVKFNTGECAGVEFEIQSYNHASKTFTLIENSETPGLTLPTDTIKPAVGDKYVLLDIAMPEAYRANAEAELLSEAQEFLSQNDKPKTAYRVNFNSIYAKQNLQSVECGDTVTLYDADLGINEKIRIVKLTKGIPEYWTISIELSNTVTRTTLQRITGDLQKVEQTVVTTNDRINRNARRAYRDSRELREMVFDPDGYFDPGHIKPLSIDAGMLAVGAKSQVFQLSSLLSPNYEGNTQKLQWSAGVLTHFSLEDTIKEWVIAAGSVTIATANASKALYIYARCSRTGTTGDIYLSPSAVKFDGNAAHWLFLIGVLHSPVDGVRGISLSYGQTTIAGQFIQTGVIRSVDGATYFDLNAGAIGGRIRFVSTSGQEKGIEEGISEAVDNLQIGTDNLINGSKEFNSDFLKAQYKCTSSVEKKTLPDGTIGEVLKITFGEAGHYFRMQNVVKKQNTDYTFSCYITRFEHSEILLHLRGAKNALDKSVKTERNKWTYVEFTFSTNLNINLYNFVGLDSRIPNAAFWLCMPKLVEGNKTDKYSESQFDINKRITQARQAAIDAVQIGGRNHFRADCPVFAWIDAGGSGGVPVTRTLSGFDFAGQAGKKCNVRIARSINANGEWTVGFDIESSVANMPFSLDVCDQGRKVFNASPAPGKAVRIVHTVAVTSYESNPGIYNFVDFGDIPNASVKITNLMIERGNKPSAYVPAPEDVQAYSETLATAQNLVQNGNFLAGLDGWARNYNPAAGESGPIVTPVPEISLPAGAIMGVKITTTAANQGIWQQFNAIHRLTLNRPHTITFWARKAQTGGLNIFAGFEGNASTIELTDEWQMYKITFTPTQNRNLIFYTTTAGSFMLTNIMLVQGITAVPFKSASLLEQATSGSTSVYGGLILAHLLGIKDINGIVRSYLSGLQGNPTAFSAGVENFGTPMERRNVEINHDGSGHVANGILSWDALGRLLFGADFSGKSISISPEGVIPTMQEIENREIYEPENWDGYDGVDLNDPSNSNITITVNGYPRQATQIIAERISPEFELTNPGEYIDFNLRSTLSYSPDARIHEIDMNVVYERKNSDGTWTPIMSRSQQNVQEIHDNYSLEIDISELDSAISPGTYRVRCQNRLIAYAEGPDAAAGFDIFSHVKYQVKAKKMVIASDGISMHDSMSDNFFRLSLQDDIPLRYKGKIDIPGVLATGSVNAWGGQAKLWGAKKSTAKVTKNGAGIYNVPHTIGHDQYTVSVTPHSADVIAAITLREDNSFQVTIKLRSSGSNTDAIGFDYVLYGHNG